MFCVSHITNGCDQLCYCKEASCQHVVLGGSLGVTERWNRHKHDLWGEGETQSIMTTPGLLHQAYRAWAGSCTQNSGMRRGCANRFTTTQRQEKKWYQVCGYLRNLLTFVEELAFLCNYSLNAGKFVSSGLAPL